MAPILVSVKRGEFLLKFDREKTVRQGPKEPGGNQGLKEKEVLEEVAGQPQDGGRKFFEGGGGHVR